MQIDYIDHMGDDLTIVNAARVSFDKFTAYGIEDYLEKELPRNVFSIPKIKEEDLKLIRFLAFNDHWTPFGHGVITFKFKAPIFVARQLFKHTVGGVVNEISRRYVNSPPEFYLPKEWRNQSPNKKQGSGDEIITEIQVLDEEKQEAVMLPLDRTVSDLYALIKSVYDAMIVNKVSAEQSRMILPQAMYTEWYWTGSIAFWARVFELRTQLDAQQETRELVLQMNDVLNKTFPVSWYFLTNKHEIVKTQQIINFLKDNNLGEDVQKLLQDKIDSMKAFSVS